jgi:hypothetical protein
MQAIVQFRENAFGSVQQSFNVAGRGINHINSICDAYLLANPILYGDCRLSYYKNDERLNKLMLRKGKSVIKTVLGYSYEV